jgi:HK97 family phage portal protein
VILGMLAADSRRWLRAGNPAIWDWQGWGYGSLGATSSSGEKISPRTAKALSAVYACIDVISTDTSVYPVDIMERVDEERSIKANDKFAGVHSMLNGSANNAVLALNVRKFVMAQCLGWGNGVGELQRNGYGEAVMMHGLETERLRPAYNEELGELDWHYTGRDGQTRVIPGADVVHFMGPSDNGVTGTSVLRYAAEAVGSGIAQQKYTASFYRNGAAPSGSLEYAQKISKEAAEEIVRDWDSQHAVGAGGMHKTAFLPHGITWKPTAISPKDSELVDCKKFSIEEVCRFYRVHPDKVMSRSQAKGWGTTEAYNKTHHSECLMPWLERAEAEYDRKLLPAGGPFYTKHNYERLLEPDAVARSDRYTKLIGVGGIKPNEVRAREGLNPEPGGDKLYIMANLVPLEDAGKQPPPGQGLPPALPPPKEPDDTEDEDEGEEAAHSAFVARTVTRSARRLLRIEGDRMRGMCDRNVPDEGLEAFALQHAGHMARDFAELFETEESTFHPWCVGTALAGAVTYREGRESAAQIAERREQELPAVWTRQVLALASTIGDGE